MGAPGLENQTGRFARSVRITDVAETTGGFPSFGYTYQKILIKYMNRERKSSLGYGRKRS